MRASNFSQAVKSQIALRVNYICSNPSCRKSTAQPKRNSTGSLKLADAAHITAASPGGPRYDSSISEAARSSEGNGIWLCTDCARMVDLDPDSFKVSQLLEWKQEAESLASKGFVITNRSKFRQAAEKVLASLRNAELEAGISGIDGPLEQLRIASAELEIPLAVEIETKKLLSKKPCNNVIAIEGSCRIRFPDGSWTGGNVFGVTGSEILADYKMVATTALEQWIIELG